ncbi:MAG: TetR/AcrR family transcriptional regulator [Thermodesulfobacteriota bacterium]
MSFEKLNTEIRQEQIAGAALSIISDAGLKGLNIAGIARRVGIVPSAVYRHFKNKDEVLDAVLDLIQENLFENVKKACEKTPDASERLRHLLMLHINLVVGNRSIPRIIFSEDLYSGHPERQKKVYSDIITAYLKKVAEIVRLGQRDRQIRSDLDPDTVSVMFLGIIQPAGILWHMSEGQFDAIRHVETAWKIFKESIQFR